MSLLLSKACGLLLLFYVSVILAQGNGDHGYFGYQLHHRGDPESAIYETANTQPGVVLPQTPDVFLNATVSVGEIDIQVDNITAKINVDAKVLNLLRFTAGVDASINRVALTIQNVSAKVHLEARLGNVVQMVGDVLNAIDLNPIIATLSQDVGDIVGNITDGLGGDSPTTTATSSATPTATPAASKRDILDYNLKHNILYSINNYSGETHTNRILAQDGTLVDVSLDNDGNERGRKVVGYYSRDMTFTGHNRTVNADGSTEFELGYKYAPFPGLEATSNIYVTPEGRVVRTQLIAEAEGGGTSTISDDDDP
ncbi:hypothetical protein F4802DRAFT_584137 [Xylaria palmicola]|nr:hypothetical protein F4802DRAFT_584137 [Xylaria palmicola]